MRKLLKGASIIGIILVIAYLYNKNQIKDFKVRDVKLSSDKISKTIKISQISDFHSNHSIEIDKLGSKIQDFNPHLIVLTGDIIDRHDNDLNTALELIHTLSSLDKDIYFIKGNHELDNVLYGQLKTTMEKSGVKILEDDISTVEIEGNHVNIMGLDYFDDKDIQICKDIYKSITENSLMEAFNLLLLHSPNKIREIVSGREDLILSGHTHGGQIRIPLIGSIIAPGQGFFPELDKGLYRIDNSILYIDSGLGNSFLPIRVLNSVQFTNITIKGESN